jgi:hypothetical protein
MSVIFLSGLHPPFFSSLSTFKITMKCPNSSFCLARHASLMASGIVWAGSHIPSLEFVCLDHRLREAADPLDFQVIL